MSDFKSADLRQCLLQFVKIAALSRQLKDDDAHSAADVLGDFVKSQPGFYDMGETCQDLLRPACFFDAIGDQ